MQTMKPMTTSNRCKKVKNRGKDMMQVVYLWVHLTAVSKENKRPVSIRGDPLAGTPHRRMFV